MVSKSFNLSGGWRQGSSKLWGTQVWKKTEWRQPNLSRRYEGATSPRRHIKIACWYVKKICPWKAQESVKVMDSFNILGRDECRWSGAEKIRLSGMEIVHEKVVAKKQVQKVTWRRGAS